MDVFVDENKNQGRSILVSSKAFIIFCLLQISFSFLTITACMNHGGSVKLTVFSNIYWFTASLPIILTRFDILNPLIYQMVFELTKVTSFACRATGYVELSSHWVIDVSHNDCIDAYSKCVLITCIGLAIEYAIVIKTRTHFKPKAITLKKSNYAFILSIIAIISFALLMKGLGGLNYVLHNYKERLTEFGSDTNLYLRYLIKFGVIGCLYYYVIDNKKFFVITFAIQMLILLAMGERGGIITGLIMPLMVVYILKNEKKIKYGKLIAVGIIVIIIYQILGNIRDVAGFHISDISLLSVFGKMIDTMGSIIHFDISSEIVYLIDHNQVGYLYGKPFFSILFAALPRKFFPWKPRYIADSALVGSLILNRDSQVYGMPPGPFAYGYLNFGWIGVVLVAIISGYFMKWFYYKFIAAYKKDFIKVPNGNVLLYALSINSLREILSTEVQINFICILVGFLILEITSKKKISYDLL